MSLEEIRERFYIPLKIIDSHLTNRERRQLRNTSVGWKMTMEDLHFGEHAVIERFLNYHGELAEDLLVKGVQYLTFEEIISLAATSSTLLSFVKNQVWHGDNIYYSGRKQATSQSSPGEGGGGVQGDCRQAPALQGCRLSLLREEGEREQQKDHLKMVCPITMSSTVSSVKGRRAIMMPVHSDMHIAPLSQVTDDGKHLVLSSHDEVTIFSLPNMEFVGWVPVAVPFDHGVGTIEGQSFIAIFSGLLSGELEGRCYCCRKGNLATNSLKVYDLESQKMLLAVNFCGVGYGEISVDGTTIGLLRYEGPVPVVHVMKLLGKDENGQMMAIGPMSPGVVETGLTFTGMEIANNYCLLEYVQEDNVEVVGFMYDISGPPGNGNTRCLVKLIPLEAAGLEWTWVKCGGHWKVRGHHLWSRTSSPTGFVVRVFEVDTREVWETRTSDHFIEKIEISETTLAIFSADADGVVKVDLRDIYNIKRGSLMRKVLCTASIQNLLGSSFLRNQMIYVFDGLDTMSCYNLERKGGSRRLEEIE